MLARALGAEWLDDYLAKWRSVELEIDGADLIAAGVPEGPALGRGLAAALRAKLDGEIAGREQELAAAAAAAGRRFGVGYRRWSGASETGCGGCEADLGGARAAFATRVGGVSEAPFDGSTSASSPTTGTRR